MSEYSYEEVPLLSIGQPTFLRVGDGYISVKAILWVESYRQNDKMVRVGLEGREHPIVLNEKDSAVVRTFCDQSLWSWALDEEEEETFVEEE